MLFTKTGKNPQDQKYELWRVPAEGGEPQKTDLAIAGAGAGVRDLRVHPDGQRITYTAGEPMKSEVWVMENFLPALRAAK